MGQFQQTCSNMMVVEAIDGYLSELRKGQKPRDLIPLPKKNNHRDRGDFSLCNIVDDNELLKAVSVYCTSVYRHTRV